MTNTERSEALKVMEVAYKKGFSLGFEAGYQKAIDNMEELIKNEAAKREATADNDSE